MGGGRHCTGACGGLSIIRTMVDSVLHSTGGHVHQTYHRPYRCDHLPTLGVIITDYRYTLRPAQSTFSQLPTGVTRVQDIGCVLHMEVMREK